MMVRALFLITMLSTAQMVSADGAVRTYDRVFDGSPAMVMADLPPAQTHRVVDGVPVFGYTHLAAPADFTAALRPLLPPDLAPSLVAGQPVNLSIALVPDDGRTRMQVMMLDMGDDGTATTAFGKKAPDGADMLFQNGAIDACDGQFVLTHEADASTAQQLYHTQIRDEGFTLADAGGGGGLSFFVGHRSDCSLLLYIRSDPDTPQHAMVVVRYLED